MGKPWLLSPAGSSTLLWAGSCLFIPCATPALAKSSYSTDKSWQDLDFALKAIFLLFFATILPRKRLAFLLMLSLLLVLAILRALSSLLSLRSRICRTMPSNRSFTLWCRAAEVSMNLQSNTTAQARPSARKRKQQGERRRFLSRKTKQHLALRKGSSFNAMKELHCRIGKAKFALMVLPPYSSWFCCAMVRNLIWSMEMNIWQQYSYSQTVPVLFKS